MNSLGLKMHRLMLFLLIQGHTSPFIELNFWDCQACLIIEADTFDKFGFVINDTLNELSILFT